MSGFRCKVAAVRESDSDLCLRDTTDESRLQDQLIQAEKSGSLDVLTAGIGHELNNPFSEFSVSERLFKKKAI